MYLDQIHDTYEVVRALSPVQLYEYFLQLEHDYIFNGTDNFCALTHRLNPRAYAAYQQKLRNVNSKSDNERPGTKYSILQMMKCTRCKTPFQASEAMQIHIFDGNVLCSCGRGMNYENIAVQTYQETFNSNPSYMVPYYHRRVRFPDPPHDQTWNDTWAYIERGQWFPTGRTTWYDSFAKVMGVLSWSGLDLILAMYRQIDFMIKICQSEESFRYWKNPEIIELSIARYYKFVTLVGFNWRLPIVPTVDIDLVWHAHLAQADQYSLYFKANFSVILNHDDTIDENSANYGYGRTYEAWFKKFREQYSPYRPGGTSPKHNTKYDTAPISPVLLAATSHIIKMGTPVNIPLPINLTNLSSPSPQNITALFPESYYQAIPFVYSAGLRLKALARFTSHKPGGRIAAGSGCGRGCGGGGGDGGGGGGDGGGGGCRGCGGGGGCRGCGGGGDGGGGGG